MCRPNARLLVGLLPVIAIIALACGSDDAGPDAAAQPAPAEPAASAPDRVSVKLALDWYPNANHLGLYIALEKGYFDEEGLDVTAYTPIDPSTVLQTVGAGKDDFGISYQPDVLLARAQGVPVVSVAGMSSTR